MPTTRRQIREKVLQVLYAFELSKDPIDKIKGDLLIDIKDKENLLFAEQLIKHVIDEKKDMMS